MNIIFLSLHKIENIEENGIYTDLLRKMRDEGHSVYVVSPIEKRYGKYAKLLKENGVQILNVKIGNITKTNTISKGFSTINIGRQLKKNISKYFKDIKFDLILYSTPPITFVSVIEYLKKRDDAKTYLLLKDIFPQNAIDLEMLGKNGIIYKYFRMLEKKLYKVSDKIGVMSKANLEYLIDKNEFLDESKIEICPNTITPVTISIEKSKKKRVREKYQIPLNKIIYIYGGNLGKPQGIDFLTECIKKNEENIETFILVVGSGTEYDKLMNFFKKVKPQNAKLLSALPKDEYDVLVNSSDVGLIFLDSRFTIPNFPSRLLSYMQASMPVIAATDKNTDIGKVIENGEFGFWSESTDVDLFNQHLLTFKDKAKLCEYGKNARVYLEDNYTTNHAYNIIMNSVKEG